MKYIYIPPRKLADARVATPAKKSRGLKWLVENCVGQSEEAQRHVQYLKLETASISKRRFRGNLPE